MYSADSKLRMDIVNPSMSELRQWVCRELVKIFPTDGAEIRSDQDHALFNAWTNESPARLGEIRASEMQDFNGQRMTEKVTTCDALIQLLVRKINSRFGKPQRGFNAYQLPLNGPGWHWFLEEGSYPQPGDFFEIGRRGGQYKHVGIVLDVRSVPETAPADFRVRFEPYEHPANAAGKMLNPVRARLAPSPVRWITIEDEHGEPSSGFDIIKRRGLRPLDAGLMGWLNIDEYFGS